MKYEHICDMGEIIRTVPYPCSWMEFGVYQGKTLRVGMNQAKMQSLDISKFFGFDSFQGLPDETEGLQVTPSWGKGVYSTKDWLNQDTPLKACRELEEAFIHNKLPVTFVCKFYDELVVEDIEKYGLVPCGFLHIDCDLCKSTMDCMTFLLENNLIKDGCIVRYDDWVWCEEGEAGESLAHKKLTEQYDIKWERLAINVFRYLGHN